MKGKVFLILAATSTVALACAILPLPTVPAPITVTNGDIAKAKAAGFRDAHALYGAAMIKLDSFATSALGSSQLWKDNQFEGYFTYRTPFGGANILYVEKPCKKTAEQHAKDSVGLASGGGSGDVVGMCQGPTVTAGIVALTPEYAPSRVCTPQACRTELVLVGYTPVYGTIAIDNGTC